jgi:hypothetical protein
MHAKHLGIACALSLIFSAASAMAIDYFPTDPGPVYSYQGGPVSIRIVNGGTICRDVCPGCFIAESSFFDIDQNGDVLFRGTDFYCSAAPDPSGLSYWPYVLYLDFPLETGKTWSTNAVEYRYFDAPEDAVTVTGTVLGPRTVTVPAGDFDVIAVSLLYHYPNEPWLSDRTEELWLQRQLGPVNGLVSWTVTISEARTTWGAVKSLFR